MFTTLYFRPFKFPPPHRQPVRRSWQKQINILKTCCTIIDIRAPLLNALKIYKSVLCCSVRRSTYIFLPRHLDFELGESKHQHNVISNFMIHLSVGAFLYWLGQMGKIDSNVAQLRIVF